MSVTSSVTTQVEFSGDVTLTLIQSALDNALANGQIQNVTLSSGNNTITAPVITNQVNTGLFILPPVGNTSLLTLKGVNGDTGFPLHLTNPIVLTVDTTFTSLVISVTTTVVGVRFVWT